MVDAIRYEAEDLRLNGYAVESIGNSGASRGKHISLRGRGSTGTATGFFQGKAGLYDVSVGFFDENDGVSSAEVTVFGNRQTFLLDKDLPGNGAGPKTLSRRVTHRRMQLQPEARFTLKGTRDRGEFARFDYIEFSPVKSEPAPVPQDSLGSKLGMNLAGIADWSTQYPFKDFFKNARPWTPVRSGVWDTSRSSTIDMDGDGWVKSFASNKPFDQVATLIPNAPKFDRYVVTYEGEGTLQFPNSKVTRDEAISRPGREVINAPGTDSIDLRIVKSDPNGTGNYIRNIQVVPEPFADLPASYIFNPDFVANLKGFETLRFMDWMETNSSTQERWENRPKPEDFTFADGKGVPVEWMVELANETGANPWFTMPHKATDDYVRRFARYVKDNLDSRLKAYVEYSNEVWNEQFDQHSYVDWQGRQMSGIGDMPAWLAYHAQRSSEIGKIWDSEFGLQKNRSIGVLGSSLGSPDVSRQAIDFLKRNGQSLSDTGIDRLAVAPYFGGAVGSSANVETLRAWTQEIDGGVSKVFEELNEGGLLAHSSIGGVINRFAGELKESADLAKQEGLQLVAYEGGQHLTSYGAPGDRAIVDLFIKVNSDPRMGQLYQEYFDVWKEQGGDVFVNYNDIGTPSKWGSWGAKENLYQPSSPKWAALQETIASWNTPSQPVQMAAELAVLPSDREAHQTPDIAFDANRLSDVGDNRTDDLSAGNRLPDGQKGVLYGEIIDLEQVDLNQDGEFDKRVQLTFSDIRSSAGYFNTVGFYKVATKDGGVLDTMSGEIVHPGAANYAAVALNERIDSIELNRNTPTLSAEVEGGTLLAPFLIANGTVDSWLAQKPINDWGGPNAYFAFEAANADGSRHIRGGSAQLEFEDFWGGGDQNFTDLVVSVEATAVG